MHVMLMTAVSAAMLAMTTMAGAAEPTPAAPAAAPAVAPDPSQQIVCRRDKETGSLVKVRKTCHTRSQWAYIDDVNQATARRITDDGTTRPAGN